MRKRLLWAALAVGLIAPLAVLAQNVVTTEINSNSVVRVANGPGGSDSWVQVDTISNRARFISTTGQTGAATSTATGGTLYWIGTAPTTWAVTMPLNPTAGELVTLATDTTLTTMVTVTANTGDTLHASYTSQTLTALTPVTFQYQLSSRTWFRLI
jgi:hypothetical protein